MPRIYFKKIYNQSGFSIIEIMVVFVIINIGLIGIMALVMQSIQAASINRYELIASHLSQEGIELVKNQRDENWINSIDWKGEDIDTYIVLDGTYTIDKNNIDDSPDDIDKLATKLYIDGSGFYNHLSGSYTSFSRLITVDYDLIEHPEYMRVESNVQWKERGRTHNYIASVILYNWR